MLNMPFVTVDEAAATKNVCHADDCGRIEGSQKLLHKHFFFGKVQIFISFNFTFVSLFIAFCFAFRCSFHYNFI